MIPLGIYSSHRYAVKKRTFLGGSMPRSPAGSSYITPISCFGLVILAPYAVVSVWSGIFIYMNRTESFEQIDRALTLSRGAELCLSIGHAPGALTIGKGRSVTGSEFDRSTIECGGSKDGVRISLEFDSVRSK